MQDVQVGRQWVPDAVHRRLPVEFPVTLEGAGQQRQVGSVVNVSPTGLYVASRAPIPAGAQLRVSLVLPLAAGPRTLVASAQVRWVNDPSAPGVPELPTGMGIEFVGLEPHARADLERLLDELHGTVGAGAGEPAAARRSEAGRRGDSRSG